MYKKMIRNQPREKVTASQCHHAYALIQHSLTYRVPELSKLFLIVRWYPVELARKAQVGASMRKLKTLRSQVQSLSLSHHPMSQALRIWVDRSLQKRCPTMPTHTKHQFARRNDAHTCERRTHKHHNVIGHEVTVARALDQQQIKSKRT